MNSVNIIGRLTHEIEVRYAQTGTAIVKFSLAVDRRTKPQNGEKVTDFLICVAMGKIAELIAQYVVKGQKLGVEGSLQMNNYKTKNGEERKSFEIFVNNIDFLEKPQSHQGTQEQPGNFPYQQQQGNENIPPNDEDLPF